MKKRFLRITAIAVLAFCAGSVWAHHSTEVYFDLNTTYLLRGVISSVAWRNPHNYAFMDVTTCKTDNWAVELPSPGTMYTAGFTSTTLQKGMPVSVFASPAKFASTAGLPEVDEAWKAKHLVLGGCLTYGGNRVEFEDGPKCTRPKQDIVIGIEPK